MGEGSCCGRKEVEEEAERERGLNKRTMKAETREEREREHKSGRGKKMEFSRLPKKVFIRKSTILNITF